MSTAREVYKLVPGMHLPFHEREFLRKLATKIESEYEDPIFVNIGIAAKFGCCSMHSLRAGSDKALLIGIDIEDQGPMPATLGENTRFIIADSSKVNLCVPGIHILFVDGDHTKEGVAADIANFEWLIVKGGYIAFHDYGHFGKKGFEHVYGVKEAVDEWIKGHRRFWHAGYAGSIKYLRKQ